MTTYAFRAGRMVRLPGSPTCPVCHGEGERGPRDYDSGAVCPECDGWGTVQWSEEELAEAEALGLAADREAREHREAA